MQKYDAIVIGGGMAGVSVAAELSRSVRVAVLEQEPQPAYHATGRSAAVFAESYGRPTIRILTRGSRGFFNQPPGTFSQTRLLRPRGCLFVARIDQREALEGFAAEPDVQAGATSVTTEEACTQVPILRPEYLGAALFDPHACDIDVHALHQGYVSLLRRNGGHLFCNTGAKGISGGVGSWRVETEAGQLEAPLLVNAAGAWCDCVAKLAGVPGIGLRPLRRTAALVDAPAEIDTSQWPLTIDIDEEFYFKPDAGRLLISPGDETPSEPCDAQPEEIDLAYAVDRIERATTLEIRRVHSRWAGLRCFVEDRAPVAGYAPGVQGFFWLAGQGGYGIQTAPALSRYAASQVLGQAIPGDLTDLGLEASALSPARLTQTKLGVGS